MEDTFWYPVYFECPNLPPGQQRAVERYFRNHRKSGGGDCGPLSKDHDGVYSVAFMNQTDQREVLRRRNHDVEVGNTTLRFTVHEDHSHHSSFQKSHTQRPPARPDQDRETAPTILRSSSFPPSAEMHELKVDYYILRYLQDCPKAGKWLDGQLASLHCTADLDPDSELVLVRRNSQCGSTTHVDDWKTKLSTLFTKTLKRQYHCHFETTPHKVKALLESSGFQALDDVNVYSGVGLAIVVGEEAQVNARLDAIEEEPPSNIKSITLQFGEDKLRLLWRQLQHRLLRDFPKVKAMRREGGKLLLEGSAADVLRVNELIAEKDKMVVGRKLSNFHPAYFDFWKKAYGTPGSLSDFLQLDDVEIEIHAAQPRVLSFSTSRLNDTEHALQREFKLKEFPFKSETMLYSLHQKVRPTLLKVNRNGCRVDVLTSLDNIIYLVGHTKEVEEQSENMTKLIFYEEEDENQTQPFASTHIAMTCDNDFSDTFPPASVSPEPAQELSPVCVDHEEAEEIARYHLSDNMEVVVCLGDITKQNTDALVNVANEDLKHSGGVASVLSKAGGPEVQKESSDLVKSVGKFVAGDVVVTSGGQLKCKKILHVVSPVNGKAGGRESAIIQKGVTSALNLCEIMEFSSIALPCVGSGICGVPIDVCTEATVSAVGAFGAVEGRSLTKVMLIDNRWEVVQSLRAQCDWLLQGEPEGDTKGATSLEPQTGAAAGVPRSSVTVEIVQGTIENQQVDAVVCPMLRGDPLSTRIGNCLRETVGRQLMDLYKEDEGVMPGDSVLVEGLTGAAFSAVFFVDLLPLDSDFDGTAIEVLRLAVSNVLTSCENHGFTSVAFPVLGAGTLLCFPEEIVAQVFQEQIQHFGQRRTSTTPFLINIVCPHQMFENDFSCVQETLEQPISQDSEPKRIILLGKTGSGKSSLGNTILGENAFEADDSPNSGTKHCQSKTKMVNGRNLTLIDTPGLFDSERPEEELIPEILGCITKSAPGPHAFLIVLKVEKFSEQERAVIAKICEHFSEEALQYATVVFTHGNQLPRDTDIKTFIRQNKYLRKLVRKCGDRCHVVDNTYWNTAQSDPYRNNQIQVESLLKTIDEMVMANNWGFYTNKIFKAMGKEIEIEKDIIKENNDSMSNDDLLKEARKRVSNRWLISLTGMGTGAVLGAVFGVEALVRLIVTAVRNTAFMGRARQLKATVGVGVTGELALTAVGATVGVAGLAGAVAGGVIGARAADDAESVYDAYEKSKNAVTAKRDEAWNAVSGYWEK